jgi:hypothetical protein
MRDQNDQHNQSDQHEVSFGTFVPEEECGDTALSVVPADYLHVPMIPPRVGAWQPDELHDGASTDDQARAGKLPLAERSTVPLAQMTAEAAPTGAPITQPLPVFPRLSDAPEVAGDVVDEAFGQVWQAPTAAFRRKPVEEAPRQGVSVLGFVFPLPQVLGCAALLVVLALCGLGTLLGGVPWLQHAPGPHLARVATATLLATTSTGTPMGTLSALPAFGGATPTSVPGGGGLAPTATPGTLPSAPTPTPVLPPTAPPNPHASNATVSFTRVTASKSSDPTMTACPSGCPLSAKAISGSQSFNPSFSTTGWNQTSIEGYIQVGNPNQHAISGVVAPYAVLPDMVKLYCQNGGSDGGAGFYVSLPYQGTTTLDCLVSSSIESPPPAGFFVHPTTLDNGVPIVVDQLSAFWSNGYSVLTQADCDNAVTQARSQANSWATNTWSNQISGWTVASGPATWTSNEYCTPNVGATAGTVTGYSTGNASGLGWHPADATALARSRLNAQVDGHFAWMSQSTCTPVVSGVSGTTITVTCGESGTEQYQWNANDTSGLQAKLASLSLADAQAACQATAGVSGGCSISLQGGTMLPSNPADITITAQ